jgi:hypothetical protein
MAAPMRRELPSHLHNTSTKRVTEMTAAEFENLDELQAELWLAGRFRSFVSQGFPPTLALAFAVHPDIATPVDQAVVPEATPAAA